LCSHAATLRQRLTASFAAQIGALDQRLALAARTLDAVSPLATLARGFAVVNGALLRDAAAAPPGTEIETRLARGRLRSRVTSSIEDDDA
jgi:exodeoxyribonuclease VII large subunit